MTSFATWLRGQVDDLIGRAAHAERERDEARKECDEARAQLAKVTEERDEALKTIVGLRTGEEYDAAWNEAIEAAQEVAASWDFVALERLMKLKRPAPQPQPKFERPQ